jgi:hypothetical protein
MGALWFKIRHLVDLVEAHLSANFAPHGDPTTRDEPGRWLGPAQEIYQSTSRSLT